MDDEFSDVFFHIATLPIIAPSFGASQSFFVDHGLPKALIAVSAETAQNLDLRVVTTPMEVDILTPALLCDQIHIGRGDPEIFRTYGQLPPHVVMPGGSATCDDQRDVPPHLASFVRFVCAVEGPLWYRAVHDGLGGMFCTNDTLYTFMFSPGNSGFVNLARDSVHVDGVLQLSTILDPVCGDQTWFEGTSGDANNVVLDVSPYFLPYGDISIHGVAYASVNNSHAAVCALVHRLAHHLHRTIAFTQVPISYLIWAIITTSYQELASGMVFHTTSSNATGGQRC